MSNKICSVDGCFSKVLCKGFCVKHYQRNKRHGDPLYYEYKSTCSIDGCNNKHVAFGYCMKHYSRYRNNGDAKISLINKDHDELCSVNGCSNKYFSKGLCKKHYERFKKYGDVNYTKLGRDLECHGMTSSPEYVSWREMKNRCINKKSNRYYRYGGRGIKVCDRWLESFANFYEDMGPKPFPKAQIDRIDNDGNYEPRNCRWISLLENMRHTSRVKLSIEKARRIRSLCNSVSTKDLAKMYGVSESLISKVIKNEIWIE